ncbi:hypothetical protein [Sporotomaculum syntrophicum]|uniref:hypothetical protein n=1 Tax=Sporotomaculum syntrophicum TaxID=182264 RepID=UPI00192A470B|nr:hypothetical protein [Sporotomaculum syntrophicum]
MEVVECRVPVVNSAAAEEYSIKSAVGRSYYLVAWRFPCAKQPDKTVHRMLLIKCFTPGRPPGDFLYFRK